MTEPFMELKNHKNCYYYTNNGVLLCGNCIEIMKNIPDMSVDLVLTDYPYGVNKEYDKYNDTKENLIDLINKTEPQIKRISKFSMITPGFGNEKYYNYDAIFVIYQPASVGLCSYGKCLWQPIIIYGKDPLTKSKLNFRWTVIQNTEISGKFEHPCPKPIKLWEKILFRGSCNSNDLILDPFLGSGTTAVAAEKLGRRWIGIEISEKYCEISKQRILAEVNQGKLF